MDPNFIKKEQLSFLGDIISSNKKTQLEKVTKLKDYLISQINLVSAKKLTLSEAQQVLLARYLKLFISKLREYAFHQQSQ